MNSQTLRRAIIIGLFIVPFIPFLTYTGFFFPYITTKAFTWRIVVEIIFALWIALAVPCPEYRLKKSVLPYAVFVFLGVIGIADILGVAPVKSFWSNFERMEGYVTLLHLGAFFVVIASVFKEVDWKKWWNTSLVASFIMGLYAFMQVVGVLNPSQAGTRVDGTFGNTIYLAVYMLFHIFLALFFLWRERAHSSLRWIYGLLMIFEIFILYHTATRGAILGLVGGLLIVSFLNIRNKEDKWVQRTSIAIVAIIFIAVGSFWTLRNSSFVLNNPVLSRFASLTTEDIKTQGRYYVWPIAIEGFREKPILGWGQENFSYVFQKYYSPEMYRLEPWFDRAHNIFLDWAVAGGSLGLLSYLSLYVALLYLVWKKNSSFTYTEKSILTGLVAAYFFHNFFVFDNLISYILFFSVLAYIYSRSLPLISVEEKYSTIGEKSPATLPIVLAVMLVVLYFVNIQPYLGNTRLLRAFAALQDPRGDMHPAVENFESAYSASRLGRPEVVEHLAINSPSILQSSSLSLVEKNSFFTFAKDAITKEATMSSDDARIQLLAGSFLTSIGYVDEGLKYLNNAKTLMPNKQQIYFELGNAYIQKKDLAKALDQLRFAYQLAPDNLEAKISYLVGAIYAGDRTIETDLKSKIPEREYFFNNSIVTAYYQSGRIVEAKSILEKRIILDPTNASTYREILDSIGK